MFYIIETYLKIAKTIALVSTIGLHCLLLCIDLLIRTDGSHARVCKVGSIGVFGFYCNFVKSGPFVTKFGTHGAADMY